MEDSNPESLKVRTYACINKNTHKNTQIHKDHVDYVQIHIKRARPAAAPVRQFVYIYIYIGESTAPSKAYTHTHTQYVIMQHTYIYIYIYTHTHTYTQFYIVFAPDRAAPSYKW